MAKVIPFPIRCVAPVKEYERDIRQWSGHWSPPMKAVLGALATVSDDELESLHGLIRTDDPLEPYALAA